MMKKRAKCVVALVAATCLSFIAAATDPATSQPGPASFTYSTSGHGPSIVLLHDSSPNDIDWARAARKLATRFEVTLIDISQFVDDSQGVRRLRQAISDLSIDDTHISGSAHGAEFAHRYARTHPSQCDPFILPQNSEDLEILADLINSTPFTKS